MLEEHWGCLLAFHLSVQPNRYWRYLVIAGKRLLLNHLKNKTSKGQINEIGKLCSICSYILNHKHLKYVEIQICRTFFLLESFGSSGDQNAKSRLRTALKYLKKHIPFQKCNQCSSWQNIVNKKRVDPNRIARIIECQFANLGQIIIFTFEFKRMKRMRIL